MPFTDRTVLSQIQGLLLEARNGGAVWGSGLWNSTEVVRYLHDQQVQLLRTTNALVSISLVGDDPNDPSVPLPVASLVVNLPGDCLRVVRVGWLVNDGPATSSEVPEVAQLEADLGYADLSTDELAAAPLGYSVGEAGATLNARTDLNTLRLSRPTIEEGWLEIWYTGLPALLTGDGELITVPDVMVPGLLWATIESMTRKLGRADDQPAAAYAGEMVDITTEAVRILLRSGQP
jgi:hypothetical protein